MNHKTLQDAGYRNPNNVTMEINTVTTTCTNFSDYIGIKNISALTKGISEKPTIIKLIQLKYLKFWKNTEKAF